MTQTVNERRIVVGIDGSEPLKQALRWAVEQARASGAPLDVVTAWEYPVVYGWGPVVDPDEVIKASEQIRTETLTEVVGHRPTVPIRTHVVGAHPAYALIQQAEGAAAGRRLPRPRRVCRCAARLGQPVLRAARDVPGRGHPRPAPLNHRRHHDAAEHR